MPVKIVFTGDRNFFGRTRLGKFDAASIEEREWAALRNLAHLVNRRRRERVEHIHMGHFDFPAEEVGLPDKIPRRAKPPVRKPNSRHPLPQRLGMGIRDENPELMDAPYFSERGMKP